MQILLGHVVPTYLPSSAVIEAVSAEPAILATVAGTDVTASLVRNPPPSPHLSSTPPFSVSHY